MIGKVSLTPSCVPPFRADSAVMVRQGQPDSEKFNKMVSEQQRAIKSEEKRRKFSMGMSVVMTTAFLAIAGVSLYPYAKGLFKKTVFQKLGNDIPDYMDDCVSKYVREAIVKRKNLAEKSPEVLKHLGLDKQANMYVFWGVPGTGKSLSAKIMAKALNAEYAEVQFSDLSSEYVGATSVNIKNKFKDIYKLAKNNPNKQYVITFNEIDSLINNVAKLGANNEHLGQNRTSFLNGLDLIKDCPNVTIIGTTNINPNSAKLDPATLSRLGNIVEIGLPSEIELVACMKYHLKKSPVANDLLNNKAELEKIAKEIYKRKGTQRDTAKIIETAISEFGQGVSDTSSQLPTDYIYNAIKNKTTWSAAIGDAENNPLEAMIEAGDMKGLAALWSRIGRFLRDNKYDGKES